MNFCLGCNRVLCNPCSGTNFDRMAPVMLCSTCMAARLAASVDSDASDEEAKSARDIAKRLSAVLQTVLARRTRAATRAQYRAGIAKLMDFGRSTHLNVLPSTPDVIWGFIMHMLVVQNLDSSTIASHVTAVGAWHDYVRQTYSTAFPDDKIFFSNPCRQHMIDEIKTTIGANYKKDSKARVAIPLTMAKQMFKEGFSDASGVLTPRGEHHRMAVMVPLLGMLRRRAASLLVTKHSFDFSGARPRVVTAADSDIQIIYDHPALGPHLRFKVTGGADKNVDSRRTEYSYVPDFIPGLDVRPLDLVESYYFRLQPPSGGFFLSAPKSLKSKTFRTNPFTGFGAAFKRAFRRVFPNDPMLQLIGSHSGRKSLAQWLHDAGNRRRLIAAAGHWFLKKEAVDLYFKTSPLAILSAIRSL